VSLLLLSSAHAACRPADTSIFEPTAGLRFATRSNSYTPLRLPLPTLTEKLEPHGLENGNTEHTSKNVKMQQGIGKLPGKVSSVIWLV
jgi:hypothetical protein